MGSFSISERYRLEIHWDKVLYEQDEVAKFEGCYLSGPAVKEIEQMNRQDYIRIDFSNQYKIFTDDFYTATFSWDGVRQTPDKIYLSNVILKNKYVNSVPKLNDDDYIVVDTKNHVPEKHQFFLMYPSFLVRADGELYKF